MSEVSTTWSVDKEAYLENMRINCILMQEQHKKQYFYLKNILQYFKLPVIIISAVNSVFISLGQAYIPQGQITTTSCVLALVCGVVGSIELYLGINAQMTQNLESQKEYSILSMNIFRMLSLRVDNRQIEGDVFLNDCFNQYIKLIENSSLLKNKIVNKLAPLPSDISIQHSPSNQSIELV